MNIWVCNSWLRFGSDTDSRSHGKEQRCPGAFLGRTTTHPGGERQTRAHGGVGGRAGAEDRGRVNRKTEALAEGRSQ